MKITVCICLSLALISPQIASAAKQKSGGGGKAAHAGGGGGGRAAHLGGGGAANRAGGARFGNGGQRSVGGGGQRGVGGGGQHNFGSNNVHGGGQTAHMQHGLNANHQSAQHGLNSHQEAQHGLTSHQEAKHGFNSSKGTQQGLNARAGKGFEGHHAAGVSANHPFNRGFAREGRFGGDHWRSGQHWRNYHALYAGYHRAWHDRGWWRGHYNRVVFVGGNYWGGNWYWDGGYWFPAWGYDPGYSGYIYDGPIFAYANLPPDQVVVNIQEALQDQGYYAGEIDGQLGQQTRDALAAYQRDHNLELSAAIDEPTVQSLGLANEEA
jgi:hypothetical protein